VRDRADEMISNGTRGEHGEKYEEGKERSNPSKCGAEGEWKQCMGCPPLVGDLSFCIMQTT